MRRLLYTIPCLILISISAESLPPSGDNAADTVRIGILSKQIRLMKDGTPDRIRISLPGGIACLEGKNGTPRLFRTISIAMRDGAYRLEADGAPLTEEGLITALRDADRDACSIAVSGQERTYPLPLELRWNPGRVDVTVKESITRYAADSALAEYGARPAKYGEALHALALLITSRALHAVRHPLHDWNDVCDLTHCQVYRGRLSAAPAPDTCTIRPGSLEVPPFFHARCGGETLGCGVFGDKRADHGVRDWLSQEGIYLCRDGKESWERAMSTGELAVIFAPELIKPAGLRLVREDDPPRITLIRDGNLQRYALEDFRLQVNRVRGWNFLKSNSYTVVKSEREGTAGYIFSGRGLGHGAGLCQEGALELAARGYTRCEILEHYFPGIAFDAKTGSPPPGLSYIIFDCATGRSERISHDAFMNRFVPFGSLFKLAVALYVAAERPDLIRDYHYQCTGTSAGPAMPGRCWNPRGHGDMTLRTALSHSCNLYFASLYRVIDRRRFMSYCSRLFSALGTGAAIPDKTGEQECARLLAGLDFRARIPVRGVMTFMRYIRAGTHAPRPDAPAVLSMPPAIRDLLMGALVDTFTEGTASGELKPYGPAEITEGLLEENGQPASRGPEEAPILPGAWGKTSTVISGTNRMVSYGIFAGGAGERGIIVLLRRGNGHVASRWAMKLLSDP